MGIHYHWSADGAWRGGRGITQQSSVLFIEQSDTEDDSCLIWERWWAAPCLLRIRRWWPDELKPCVGLATKELQVAMSSLLVFHPHSKLLHAQIGRELCRERVWQTC